MPVYTVHAPTRADVVTATGADHAVFVRDGFHVWAFVFGPLWLLAHRLWLASLGYVVLSVVGAVVLTALGAGDGLRFAVTLLFALLMGLEAASLRRWTLSRGKWRQIDVVVADNPDAAERRIFDRWDAQRGRSAAAATDRGAPPPSRHVQSQPFSQPAGHDGVIGLFPQPGVTR